MTSATAGLKDLKIRGSAIFSHPGDRPAQEDHALVLEDKKIFAVADGFGGPGPGSLASRAACESLKSFLFKEAGDLEATMPFELRSYFSLAGNVLFNALIHANGKLKRLNQGKGVHERGGASVIAGFMDGDLLALAGVGACSAWLFRGAERRELLMPRTYGRLIDPFHSPGHPGHEELQVPLIALGISDDLEPEIVEYRIQEGDWLFLHTDGVSGRALELLGELHQSGSLPGIEPSDLIHDALRVLEQDRYSDNAAASIVAF